MASRTVNASIGTERAEPKSFPRVTKNTPTHPLASKDFAYAICNSTCLSAHKGKDMKVKRYSTQAKAMANPVNYP